MRDTVMSEGYPLHVSPNWRPKGRGDLLRPPTVGDYVQDSTNNILGAIAYLLLLYACPREVIESFSLSVYSYLTRADPVLHVKRLKYVLAYPMAKYLGNDPPPYPDDTVFRFGGAFRRWMKSRFSQSPRNTHLWWSFFQAKRAALPVPESFIQMTLQSHRQQMGAADPLDSEGGSQLLAELMDCLEPVLSGISQALAHRQVEPIPESEIYSPSLNACYEATRASGGQAGHLLGVTGNLDRLPPRRELLRMDLQPLVFTNGRYRRHVIVPTFGYPFRLDFYSQVIERYGVASWGAHLTCRVQGILEPLKVRTITKGPAVPYYLSKLLQKALWSELFKLPCFRLIGQPVDGSMIMALKLISPATHTYAVSVDYSAATDGLSAKFSAAILSRLVSGFPPAAQTLWLSVLAPHRVEYPEDSGLPPIEQQNGQLMGSPLSFPVLCLANLACYLWLARKLEPEPLPVRNLLDRVLVNGDDMLYFSPSGGRYWSEHVDLGRRVGLVMSIGKAYVSQRVASVNSQVFHLRSDGGDFWHVPTMNMGLMKNQSKVLRVSSESPAALGLGLGDDGDGGSGRLSTIPELLRGVPLRITRGSDGAFHSIQQDCLVLKDFIHLYSDTLRSEARGRNWFIHRSLGGLGLIAPSGWRWEVSKTQLAVASQRLRDLRSQGVSLDLSTMGSGPLMGPEPGEPDEVSCPYLVGSVAADRDKGLCWPKEEVASTVVSVRFEGPPRGFNPCRVDLDGAGLHLDPVDALHFEPDDSLGQMSRFIVRRRYEPVDWKYNGRVLSKRVLVTGARVVRTFVPKLIDDDGSIDFLLDRQDGSHDAPEQVSALYYQSEREYHLLRHRAMLAEVKPDWLDL